MILVANGCSHTAGAELEYPNQDNCYERAWPKHLADLNGWDHVNLAISGASCDRILRTTYEYIGNLGKTNTSLKDLFVIIMWPGPYRTELYHPKYANDPLRKGWVNLVSGNHDNYKKQLPKHIYEYYRYWIYTYTYEQAFTEYAVAILSMQSYLRSYNIPYLFWNAAATHLLKDEPYDVFARQIYTKRFPYPFEVEKCYYKLLENGNQKIAQPSIESGFASHYDEEGQKYWANFLSHYIFKNQLVSC